MTVAGDLRTACRLRAVFDRVNERFKRCDILVNNAGATRAGNFLDLPDEAWLDGYALKFFGAVRLSRLFWPLLKAAQGPRRQHHRRRGAHRRAGIPDRRLGQFRGREFHQGPFASSACATASTSTPFIRAPPRPSAPRICCNSARPPRARASRRCAPRPSPRAASAAWRRRKTSRNLRCSCARSSARHIQGTATAVDGGGTPGLY